jgi:hypothetical protein
VHRLQPRRAAGPFPPAAQATDGVLEVPFRALLLLRRDALPQDLLSQDPLSLETSR